MNTIALNQAVAFRLFAAIFFFLFTFSFQFDAHSQCEAIVDWELTPMPLPDNPEYSISDTIDICVDVQTYYSDFLHGVGLILPMGWELLSATSDEDCGEGEWIFVENPSNSNLGPGFYYDSNIAGPQDGNPFNNWGTAYCTGVSFCFQVRQVELTAEQMDELGDNPLGPSVIVVGDSFYNGGWSGPNCTAAELTHYLDVEIPFAFGGQEIVGEVELNPSSCPVSSVEIQLLEMGTTTLVESQVASVNPNGTYSTYMDAIGQYDVRVMSQGYLSEIFPSIELAQGTNTLETVSMISGDINGDNQINIVDVSLLGIAFGYEILESFYDPTADLNCDGSVNIQDVSILGGSFGMVGE